MSKTAQNILANCFKKTVKNVKDYIPPTVKTEIYFFQVLQKTKNKTKKEKNGKKRKKINL